MTNDLRLLGIARKAGRLAVGETAVTDSLRRRQAQLLLLASDAAENTRRRFLRRGEDVPYLHLPYDKMQLGRALGYTTCALATLNDEGLAKSFLQSSGLQPIIPASQTEKNGGAR